MKRITLMFLALIFVASIIALPVHGETLNQEFADANGYVIYTNPTTGEIYYLDKENYIPNQIYVYTEDKLDISKYTDGTETDFYGVKITKIEYLGQVEVESGNDEIVENPPIWHEYLINTSNYYKIQDVNNNKLFSNVGVIKDSSLRYGKASAENTVPVLGDVNLNGKIDSRDYLLLKRAYFGTTKLPCDISVADVNGNGKLDSRDYMLLKRAYFGTYTIGTPDPDATSDEA